MMRKKLASAFTTLAILAVAYGLFFVIFSMNGEKTPKAEDGYLDLMNWEFQDRGAVPLDGEWEFYPGQLLRHDDLAKAPNGESMAGTIQQVPASWSGQQNEFGMATYRLNVKVDDTTPIYGLKTSSVQISNRVFVNGQIVGESGNPAERAQYKAENRPYTAYFNLQPGWNEIVVQVANYEFPASSGINESILFGYAEHINDHRSKALSYDWITFTAFLIMGLYFIGLYSQRREDVSLLAFALVCISIALFTSTRGERVIYSLLGSIPYWLYIRIQIFAAISGGMSFLFYVYTAFRPFVSKWIIRTGVVVGAVMVFLVILLGSQVFTEWYRQITTIYATFPLLYAVYIFVLAAMHRIEGSLYLVVAAIALNFYALVQNLNVYFGVPVYQTVPFEPFLFLLMLALLMSLRFSNAYREIEDLSVRLMQADKLKDEFLARTSHEFKTPLHGIMLISKSMLEDAKQPPSEEQRDKLQLISGITEQLSQLVYDILDYSKLKQGEMTVELTTVDVRSVVELQMQLFSYLSESRHVRLENAVSTELPYVMADEGRFSQIMSNLLDNAVKHTDHGIVTVSAEVNRDMVEINVQDTGEGIDENDMPMIFEAFKTSDTSMRRKGFGLGLSIVKQLVELQKGTITVNSVKGAGTTVKLAFPLAGTTKHGESPNLDDRVNSPLSEISMITPYYLKQNGKHTVMIVDDYPINLKILMDTLAPLHVNVIAVQNGYEALDQIEGPQTIDLVILDLMMPGMSGFEVCREIRKKHTMLELPVLMVTAANQPQDKVAAFEAGANDFLPKPFDVAELKARIGSLLSLRESLRRAVDLELAFLRSQIKPHFLYNVLNSIVGSSYTDVERSRKLTMDLAQYLRGSFRFNHVDRRVSFAEEFELIQTYVQIEQMRFKDRIRFQYDIADSIYNITIPPLLLQPLVENAIRHGISDRIEGGTVKLTADQMEKYYRFVIEDDGVGMDREWLKKWLESEVDGRRGVGLLNIHKRVQYEFGTTLQIESEPGKGTKVSVWIPIASID